MGLVLALLSIELHNKMQIPDTYISNGVPYRTPGDLCNRIIAFRDQLPKSSCHKLCSMSDNEIWEEVKKCFTDITKPDRIDYDIDTIMDDVLSDW